MSQLNSIGDMMSKEDKAITLLFSLPNSWNNLIKIIHNTISKLTLDVENGTLLDEETRRKTSGAHDSGGALMAR